MTTATPNPPLIQDWTAPLYHLQQAWNLCATDINTLTQTCRREHGKPAAIQCSECHVAIVSRIQQVFHPSPDQNDGSPTAWFTGRTSFLEELDSLFEDAKANKIDMAVISNRILEERVQWYIDMITSTPLFLAALEHAQPPPEVSKLLGGYTTPTESHPPVKYDFEELSEALAGAIGAPPGRLIGPKELESYTTARRGTEDDAAKQEALSFFFSKSNVAPYLPETPTYLPGTEKYATIYETTSTSLITLASKIESDLLRTATSNTRRNPSLTLPPATRQRIDNLHRLLDTHSAKSTQLSTLLKRIAELHRARRAADEEAAQKKRAKAAAEEKKRAEAQRAADVDAKNKAAAAAEKAEGVAAAEEAARKKIPPSMYEEAVCSAPNCEKIIDPKDEDNLGCAICVLGVFTGRVEKQTLYCDEKCYTAGHDLHTTTAHPCNSGQACLRLAPSQPPATPVSTTSSSAGTAPDSTTAVACLMCDVRLQRDSFFCCLACAKSNKDAHIANFHADAFIGGRGMPKTLMIEDYISQRLAGHLKGFDMITLGKK